MKQTMNKASQRLIGAIKTILLIAIITPLLAGCKESVANNNEQAPPPPTVSYALPAKKEIQQWDEFSGRFEAVDKVEIRPRVGGYLQKIHFKDGDTIKKGDILFTIDQRPFQNALRESQAAVASAQNKLNLAKAEFQRAEKLSTQGFASKQLLDERIESRQSASSDLEAARAKLEQAKLDLDFSTVTSPINGRISQSMIDEGNLITVGADTPLTTIVSTTPIHFYFDIDEQTYLKYANNIKEAAPNTPDKPDTIVQIALANSDIYNLNGTIDFIDNALNEKTGTLRGRAIINNEDGTILAGMFGRARIQSSKKINAILIPDEAVGIDQSRNFVLTIGEGNIIQTKPVTLGTTHEGMRIVQTGLTGDEKVIVSGIPMLQEGMPVAPQLLQPEKAEQTEQPEQEKTESIQ